ncbi:ATP-binding protein [Streptomyces sp. NPDC014861]|uniref:ATP-binding protein n=1 Tax=Streptomyces sp. NPDC014861 TaxID=3364923 RepID=UPI0036F646AC
MTALTLTASSRVESEARVTFTHAACSAVTSNACVPVLRRFVVHCVRRLGLSEDLRDAAGLVSSELITNAVLHSGSHSVAVLVSLEGHSLVITVRDEGGWRTRIEPRRSLADDDAPCGRGLSLVEMLTKCLSITTGPRGTVVKASLHVDASVSDEGAPCDV